jgi:hypothetical protein
MNSTLLIGLAVCARTTSAFDTSTFDNVTLPGWPALPGIPTALNASAGDAQVVLRWLAATNATGYNVKQAAVSGGPYANAASGVTSVLFTNAGLSNGTSYYFVVSGVNVAGESGNSSEVSARPVSLVPPRLSPAMAAGQFQLDWPADHLGWRLEAQTNSINSGLSTNWFTVPASTNVNQLSLPALLDNDSVFFRLVYP